MLQEIWLNAFSGAFSGCAVFYVFEFWVSYFFRKRTAVLIVPDQQLSPEERAELRRQWEEIYGGPSTTDLPWSP